MPNAAIAALLIVVACGRVEPNEALTGEAAVGLQVAREQGCMACHGYSGGGGSGPPLVGLAGSTVILADGSTVIADDAYLERAIRDPLAELVSGYSATMLPNFLTNEQIASLIAYITAVRES